MEERMLVWRGVGFVGFWKSALLILDERKVSLTFSLDDIPLFALSVKVVEVADDTGDRFVLKTGVRDFQLKAPVRDRKDRWIEAL